MERIKKISANGQILLNDTELEWVGLKRGDLIVIKDDDGKYGKFLSLFVPGERHQEIIKYKNNDE